MNKIISREFLEVMNNFRKLTYKYHPKSKIHMGEFMMLDAIHGCMEEKKENHIEEPGVKVGELSEIMHSTKPATSKMLKAIEEKGYIERVTDSKDRRVVYVRLLDSGETIIKDAFNRMDNFTERTINRMGEEDSKDLIRLMRKLYQAVTEELKEKHSDTKCHIDK